MGKKDEIQKNKRLIGMKNIKYKGECWGGCREGRECRGEEEVGRQESTKL